MAENENVVVENDETLETVEPESATPENNKPSKGKKFAAAVKEWFRKKIVALKRKPQTIALVVMVITTLYFMLSLYVISQAIDKTAAESTTPATGICVFITTLLSLLYLVSFLNAFPKRKKPNIFFIVLVFVMIAAMIACDIGYFVQMQKCIATFTDTKLDNYLLSTRAQPFVIVHIVLLGVSALVFALLPVYSKLINKIDTSVKVESATEHMNGQIDIQED